jgi:hypothetical protein
MRAKEFNQLVEEIWGGQFSSKMIQGVPVAFKKSGLGYIYKAPYLPEDFTAMGVERDIFASENTASPPNVYTGPYAKGLAFTHRKSADKDIYFIANQLDKVRELNLIFNIGNQIPVIYDAVTDDTIRVNNWSTVKNKTVLTLRLEAHQSLFVLFEQSTKESKLNNGSNWIGFKTVQDLSKDWQVDFDPAYAGPTKPVMITDLEDWTSSADTLIRYYSGTAVYSKKFSYQRSTKEKLWLSLGEFSCIAGVKINGIDCGTLWTAPHRLEISKAIKNGDNRITIEIANTWGNRLIGDSQLPEALRSTHTTAPFRLEGKPLYPAGLIGPVVIQSVQ